MKNIFSILISVVLFLNITLIRAEDNNNQIKKIKFKKKSPTKALFMGMVLPGSGEFYNKKYLKGIIFLSAGLYLGYKSYYYYDRQKDYYDKYLIDQNQKTYEKYKENYDKMQSYIYFYIINLAISKLDGVVESYLYNWHVEDIELKSEINKDNVTFVISKKL